MLLGMKILGREIVTETSGRVGVLDLFGTALCYYELAL